MPSDLEGESLLQRDSDLDCDSNMVTIHGTPHQEGKIAEEIGQADSQEDEAKAVQSGGSGESGEKGIPIEEDEDDDELGSFIRIRSQGDGIFEQDDDDDDDEEEEFYDFAIPEVEMKCPSRKRKQDISFIDNDLSELIEVPDHDNYEEEQEFRVHEAAFRINPELFKSRKRERMPLYLLNPNDFEHDPKKQHQIRRAIITYRHHQDKKQQIIKLTDENKKLREHVQTLKSKIIELSRCGCKKNQNANIDVLGVEISTVPPRMYIRGSRPVLAVPYNRCSLSPDSFSKSSSDVVKTELEATSTRLPSVTPSTKSVLTPPAQTLTTETIKPLINITSSRLANLNSKTLSSHNVVTHTLPKPPASKVFTNGTSATTLKGLQMSGASRISITGASANKTGFIPISLATPIKSEPGIASNNLSMNIANSKLSTTTITSPIPMTATVKSESVTPATAPPVSRIVFAKKGNTSNAVQTASQLLFGTKTTPQGSNNMVSKRPVPALQSPLTASQLAFANRNNTETTIATNPLNSIINKKLPSQPNQIFKTASGQVLKLVQPSPVPRTVSSSAAAGILAASQWKPIAPRPAPPTDLNSAAVKKQCTKEYIEDMWKRFAEDDEDEMAIIAAINDTSPPQQRNRKQNMGSRTKIDQEKANIGSNAVLKSCGQVIELDKYQDIVFEEAD